MALIFGKMDRLSPARQLLVKVLSSTPIHQHHRAAQLDRQTSTAAHGLKSVAEIPGPRHLPFVGAMLTLLTDRSVDVRRIHLYFDKLYKIYGPIMRFGVPGTLKTVVVYNPDDIQTVYMNTQDNPIRNALYSLKMVRDEALDNYFEKKGGILAENGEEWKRVRSRVQSPMMKPKNAQLYLPQMDEVTVEFMDKIQSLQDQFGEMPENFQTELYKWALESVGLVALNTRLGCLQPNLEPDSKSLQLITTVNDVFDALNETEIGSELWRYYPTKAYRRLKKCHETFIEIADGYIRDAESKLDDNNDGDRTLMEVFLSTPGLSRKDVVTIILDMLFAGIDTTSHTLAFVMYLLARNPEVQGKLQEEIDNVIGDSKVLLTSHLGRLPYLKAVIKETLRMFPISLGTIRTLQTDAVLHGYLVPKDWHVMTLNMLTSKDEKFFQKPLEFIPERWLKSRPLGPIHPYASLPFGIGTRMCIGRRIAEQEMYIFIARLMQRFNVDYKYKDIDVVSRLVLTPSEPLKFTFSERAK